MFHQLVGPSFFFQSEDVVSRPALPTGPAGHVLLAACRDVDGQITTEPPVG